MAISQKNYVNIISGVGAATSAADRELIGRYFTTNHLVPTDTILEFTSSDAVGNYFGFSSEEYLRAVFYFGWVSKNITSPQKISFARWTDADQAPEIYGAPGAQSIVTWNAITAGSFNLVIGGVSRAVTGLNFSSSANLAAVAAAIQTAVRAISAGGTMYTSATVTYDAVRGSFNFVGGLTGNATITVTAGTTGTDIAGQLGWITPGVTIYSNGDTLQTIAGILASSTNMSNNYGSFTFIPSLTLSQVTEAAQWNLAQNVRFMYSVNVTAANAATWTAALEDIGGTTLTLDSPSTAPNEWPEMCPMMIEAATNYNQANSTQNYEYQIFNLTPSVTDDAGYALYTGMRINFYGQTQKAGRLIEFYQEGVMFGLPVDPADQNTYANEQWFKDALEGAFLTLMLALPKVSANATGRSQLLNTMQSVIDRAVFNGTVSAGKPLTDAQKQYITVITNDNKAFYQVQDIGYWRDIVIQPYTVGNVVKYKAVPTLVYSKDDVIRLVEGRDILI